jgi:hypothetical protein
LAFTYERAQQFDSALKCYDGLESLFWLMKKTPKDSAEFMEFMPIFIEVLTSTHTLHHIDTILIVIVTRLFLAALFFFFSSLLMSDW